MFLVSDALKNGPGRLLYRTHPGFVSGNYHKNLFFSLFMKTGLLSILFFFGSLLLASAQSSGTAAQGSNPNSDAPVNVSEPSLRPAQPATYSATSVPDSQKGQFYVKDDKPAYSDFTPVEAPTPEMLEERKRVQARKDAELRADSPSPKSNVKPSVTSKSKAGASQKSRK
ncbi:MAG: hypothetical protein EOP51_17225 [Sphingobacteriales bacterium]|nr:MAG: hypothetical protein EOP51_17225 [Sphingobacteriales bacterium]